MDRPQFTTAIPQHRYQIGEYTAVLLGDIEATDGKLYHYILAVVVEGAKQPKVYVTLEKNRGPAAQEGSHLMRVIAEGLNQEIGSSDQWRRPDEFAAGAIAVVMKLLRLTDEQPIKLS